MAAMGWQSGWRPTGLGALHCAQSKRRPGLIPPMRSAATAWDDIDNVILAFEDGFERRCAELDRTIKAGEYGRALDA